MSNKKLIFLENKYQAEEYLRNKKDFREYLPIPFRFEVEKILNNNGIKFKLEEDYENYKMYDGIHKKSVNYARVIGKNFSFEYKNIDLMPIFFYKLYVLFSSTLRNFILLREIIKKENPKEIFVFEKEGAFFYEDDFASRIIPSIFKGKIRKRKYFIPPKKLTGKEVLINFYGFFQKVITNLFLKFNKNKRKIFEFSGRQYYKKVLEFLNKENYSLVDFGDFVGKSFFINGDYVPFYFLSGKRKVQDKIFLINIENLLSKLENSSLTNKIGLEKEIEERIKVAIKDLIKIEFPKVARKIGELIDLIKTQNIKLFLLADDTADFGGIVARVAKLYKIPTVVFQHGYFASEIGQNSISDNLFMFGEESKKTQLNLETSQEM